MAKKQFNNFQWDGEFQSKPKHNPKPGKQSSSGKPSGKPATQHPQNKPALPKMGTPSQPSVQPAPTPASPRGGKPNSRYKPQLRALPVEMYVAAAGNPLAQSLLMALQHEGKPEGMSEERFLKRFAQFGWNGHETSRTKRILRLWQETPSISDKDKNALLGFIGIRINTINSSISATTSESARDALVQELIYLQNNSTEIFDDPQRYASLLEAAFGYNIEFGQDFIDKDKDTQLRQLTALAQSNLMIVSYLNSIGLSGFAEFQQFFASTSDGKAVTVHLGDNEKSGGPFVGLVPLPASAPAQELDEMYLGSGMTTAAIIHEFFHQLDRHFAQGLSVDDTSDALSIKEYLTGFVPNSANNDVIGGLGGLSFTADNVLMGRANPLDDLSELFADYGMTAVVDAYGGTFYAQANNSGRPVGFEESRNAHDIRCALRQYFLQLMTGTTTDMSYDPELCS